MEKSFNFAGLRPGNQIQTDASPIQVMIECVIQGNLAGAAEGDEPGTVDIVPWQSLSLREGGLRAMQRGNQRAREAGDYATGAWTEFSESMLESALVENARQEQLLRAIARELRAMGLYDEDGILSEDADEFFNRMGLPEWPLWAITEIEEQAQRPERH